MLHDRGQRYGKWPCERTDREDFALFELRKKCAPRRVSEGGKGAVKDGILMLNHMVMYELSIAVRQLPLARIAKP